MLLVLLVLVSLCSTLAVWIYQLQNGNRQAFAAQRGDADEPALRALWREYLAANNYAGSAETMLRIALLRVQNGEAAEAEALLQQGFKGAQNIGATRPAERRLYLYRYRPDLFGLSFAATRRLDPTDFALGHSDFCNALYGEGKLLARVTSEYGEWRRRMRAVRCIGGALGLLCDKYDCALIGWCALGHGAQADDELKALTDAAGNRGAYGPPAFPPTAAPKIALHASDGASILMGG